MSYSFTLGHVGEGLEKYVACKNGCIHHVCVCNTDTPMWLKI